LKSKPLALGLALKVCFDLVTCGNLKISKENLGLKEVILCVVLNHANSFFSVQLDQSHDFIVLLGMVQSTDLERVNVSFFEFHIIQDTGKRGK
jgi:hypothetical protein